MNTPKEPPSVASDEYDATLQDFDPNIPLVHNDPVLGRRYTLTKKLGEGGMGQVWGAIDNNIPGRKVAIKFLIQGQTRSFKNERKRFEQEATIMGRLTGPYVVHIHDRGALSDGTLYIVMDYLEGHSLESYLEQKRQIDWRTTLGIVCEVGQALTEAHALHIIHRDLKPANIFLQTIPGDRSQVKVLDFGIAKKLDTSSTDPNAPKTLTGFTVGTPLYMCPEQVAGEEPTPSWDIYSLGVVAFECLTGKSFSAGEYLSEDAQLQAPKAVKALIDSMIAQDVIHRVKSATEIVNASKALLREDTSTPKYQSTIISILAIVLVFILTTLAAYWYTVFSASQAIPTGTEASPNSTAIIDSSPPLSNPVQISSSANIPSSSDMILIPGGPFTMGCTKKKDPNCRSGYPEQTKFVAEFYIDPTEVTVDQFGDCVASGYCQLQSFKANRDSKYCNWGQTGRGRHPINCVTWAGALAYCKYRDKRLPSDVEWEKAARGLDARKYPWGNTPVASCSHAIVSSLSRTSERRDGCGHNSTWPVGSKRLGVSPYHIFDMAGNVWEWTSTKSPDNDEYSIRGGGWLHPPFFVQTTYRRFYPAKKVGHGVGFRCVKSYD